MLPGLPASHLDVPSVPGLRLAVIELGTACCAVELVAAIGQGLLVPADPAAPPPRRVVLVAAGTVTDVLLPAVTAAVAETGADAVVAFGACTISGGPYWDSYAVAKGIGSTVLVAAYVPGCPPRPHALVSALAEVAGLLADDLLADDGLGDDPLGDDLPADDPLRDADPAASADRPARVGAGTGGSP